MKKLLALTCFLTGTAFGQAANNAGPAYIPGLLTQIVNPANGQCLVYNSTTKTWNNAACTGAAGSVTSVSVASANGFAGTVANPTSTPAITLTTAIAGLIKGSGGALTAGAFGDVTSLWTTGGTCSTTTWLRGDGSCTTPPGTAASANPSASSGPTAVNGTATTFMTSDSAPAINLTSNYTWTGTHTFNGTFGGTGVATYLASLGTGTLPTTALTSANLPSGVKSSAGNTLVDTTSTNNSFYISENFTRTTVVTTAPAQNATKVQSFYVSRPVGTSLTGIYFYVTTADNSTNQYDLGIYGPNCNNSTASVPLIAHTGATNGSSFATAAATGHLAWTGGPITATLAIGWYCIALTSSAATPSMIFGGNSNGADWGQFANNLSPGSGGTTTGGTLNSTITAPALNQTTVSDQWFVLY